VSAARRIGRAGVPVAALGWLAAALAACSHAEPPPPAAPRGPTACDRAADSMVGAMLARLPAADAPTEQADALRRLIRVRCEQDGWPADATRCLIAMQKLADAGPCAGLMPDDQQAALSRDLEAAFPRRAAGDRASGAGSTAPGTPANASGSARPDPGR
jgi:hypothetical protein